jgi:tetratricopeptide (TPR) repeat protein
MKAIFLVAAMAMTQLTVMAQELDKTMYEAYLINDNRIAKWEEVWKVANSKYATTPNHRQEGLQNALVGLGLLNATMSNQNEDVFDDYYDLEVALLEKLIATDKKWAEPLAILSAVYGLKMGYSPMQGMFLGPKSSSLIEKAIKLSPSSPLVWKVQANSKFFTPEMFGGDLKESIAAYEKCIALYESKPDELKSNWMYLDALAFYGQACLKNGETGKSIATFEKALKTEPQFGWVKFSLLPKARGQSNGR